MEENILDFTAENKQPLRVDIFTANFMLKALEKDLSYFDEISLEDFKHTLPQQEALAKAMHGLYKEGFKSFSTTGELILHATTGKYQQYNKIIIESQMLEIMLTLESLLKEENYEIYVKNFKESVESYNLSVGIIKKRSISTNFSLRDAMKITKEVDNELENLMELDFLPVKLRPRKINILVGATDIGKTRFTLTTVATLAAAGKRVLYITTEERQEDAIHQLYHSKPERFTAEFLSNIHFIYKDYFSSVEEVFTTIKEADSIKADIIVFDYMAVDSWEVDTHATKTPMGGYAMAVDQALKELERPIVALVMAQAGPKLYNLEAMVTALERTDYNYFNSGIEGGKALGKKADTIIYISVLKGVRTLMVSKSKVSNEQKGKAYTYNAQDDLTFAQPVNITSQYMQFLLDTIEDKKTKKQSPPTKTLNAVSTSPFNKKKTTPTKEQLEAEAKLKRGF